jgi:hypothetical protein
MMGRSRTLKIGLVLLVCAVAGASIFGVLVWRAVTIERAEHNEVERRFGAARAGLPSAAPLVDIDDAGRVTRMTPVAASGPRPISRLKALAWRAPEQRLVSADTPFWFFRLKGPAARYALDGTGLDLDRLHLTARDLERFGPAVIVDHTSRDGSRLLVWTE